eukprot:scaffold10180_cov304-Chaetoceros_neogracile.AAC.20
MFSSTTRRSITDIFHIISSRISIFHRIASRGNIYDSVPSRIPEGSLVGLYQTKIRVRKVPTNLHVWSIYELVQFYNNE